MISSIYEGEPNNAGGNTTFIRESCVNYLGWEGYCLNDDHCEFEFVSICQIHFAPSCKK